MKVGTALSILAQPGRPDAALFNEHMALGDFAEPLGFDSLFALEHHFTGYSMSPAPLQLLSYYAGRTRRITLGTCVIVLPWHDPIRVAEQIALLDVVSGGRTLMGFGRGAASAEYAGFRIPMEEARPRFVESAKLIIKALSDDIFDWNGEFYQIPSVSIRPRPISHPERRFYASSVSPESAEVIAKLGFGLAIVMQNEWPKAAEDVHRYRDMVQSVGHTGYESYGKLAKTYAKMKDESFRAKATDFYLSIQIVGTPDDCVQQIAELRRLTGMDHLVTEFSFGSMPHHLAELNLRRLAEDVLPVLQRDAAFQGVLDPAAATTPAGDDRLFALAGTPVRRLLPSCSPRSSAELPHAGRRTSPAGGGDWGGFHSPLRRDASGCRPSHARRCRR